MKNPPSEFALNFGPSANQNHSVQVLLDEMSQHWEKARWQDISNNIEQQYEAGLLKLNCDKATHLLNWSPSLDSQGTIKFTADWYREYYAAPSKNMRDITMAQIEDYTNIAKKKGIAWAI